MVRRLIPALLAALVATALGDPHIERRWTGTNGGSFTGAYMGTDPKTGKFSFALANGKSYLIDPNNLSKEDREWLDLELHPEKKPRRAESDPDSFLPDPDLDRTVFPTINQSDFGSKASDCVPSAFCNFVLWWDMKGYLPIDKKGDFDKKAEYIHSRMARYFRTRNNAGTDLRHAAEGVNTYFERDLAELATVRVLTDYNCDPDNLRRYTTGANATLLGVSVYYGRKDEGGHVVALSHVDDNGDLIMSTWGARIRGRLSVIEKDLRLPKPTTSLTGHKYAVEFMNRGDLPEWMIDNEVRFEIDPSSHDGLMVIAPYRYKTPGRAIPPPPDPIMQPGPPKKPEFKGRIVGPGQSMPLVSTLTPPPMPHKFAKPAMYSREWTFTDGSTLTARPARADDRSVTFLTNDKTENRELSALTPADQARILLWRGITTESPPLRQARLDYLLTRTAGPEEFTFPVHIYLSGNRFRLDMPAIKPVRSIIGDIKTGAFLVRWDNDKHFVGRLSPDRMLPPPPTDIDISAWEQWRDSIPAAPPGSHPDWPCRILSMPSNKSPEHNFLNPAMMFSSIESPALTAAILHLLSPDSVARGDSEKKGVAYGIFSSGTIATGHWRAREFLGFCNQSRLVPLRLQWTNTYDPNSPDAKAGKPRAGLFRLDLTKLELAPQPEELFEIPDAAATVPVHNHRVIRLKK